MSISFVDIETGNVFDGSAPYIFWFNNGSSTNLIYTKHICFISDKSHHIIKIDSDSIFNIINPITLNETFDEDINSFKYKNLTDISCNMCISKGYKYNNVYLHNIYFTATSESIGEYLDYFYIDEYSYKLGIDVYEDNENIRINLSNFGIDMTDSVQKAIYDNNIHEDSIDNILLNRKFKELLSNYWDIIANKGSYKSLINSLNWFEYGELIKIKEIWKTNSGDREILRISELNSLMSKKYENYIYNYSKTTYIALYMALQEIISDKNGIKYDDEKNPELKNISLQWSINDMAMKMSMLGSFYEYYFMPIHLDLIHSTIESVIFTNTIKILKGVSMGREDVCGDFDSVICNVNEKSIFKITNTSIQVDLDTVLRNNNIEYNTYIVGVRPTIFAIDNDNDLKLFHTQNYTGVGVMVPISLNIPLQKDDVIKNIVMSFIPDGKDEWITKSFNLVSDHSLLEFNMLCTEERLYEIRITVNTIGCKSYSKVIKFNTIDVTNIGLDVFKISCFDEFQKEYEIDEFDNIFNNISNENTIEYMFNRFKSDTKYYSQILKTSEKGPGPKLNNILIIKDTIPHDQDKWIKKNYHTVIKNKHILDTNDNTIYTICVSKKYYFKPQAKSLDGYNIYRNDYGFFPNLHKLDKFGGERLEDYTVTDEILCIAPQFKYGKLITGSEWEFVNYTTGKSFTLPGSIRTPMVLMDGKNGLDSGYYNIIFRYCFVDGKTHEIKLNSAFLKK